MNLTPNAIAILKQRYMEPDETPEERFKAVAERVARAEVPTEREYWANQFYTLLLEPLNFLPNSPTIANCRRDACLSACFVMSPEDNLESIFKVSRDAGMVIASGGGMGFGLSDLREEGAPVGNVQKLACGPIAVLRKYSEDSHMVAQGFRLGANMAQMAADHPDIRKFIHVKDDYSTLTNFNLSVQVTDAFIDAVLADDPWHLWSRHNGEIVETVNARDLWREIAESAHRTGDPGLVFIERVHETAPNPHLGPIKTSNPCGEEFLEDYNSCCLGSINLSNMVLNDSVDWQKLEVTTHLAVRFLDDVIDSNNYPVPKLRSIAQATRRIGLGIMGWADLLAKLGIPYGSDKSITLADELGYNLQRYAWFASEELAREKGYYPEFPNGSLRVPVRNSSVITFAPTGTISRIAGCSSGIEPYFDLIWESNVLWNNQGYQARLLDCPAPLRRDVELTGHQIEELKDAIESGLDVFEEFGINREKYRTSKELTWKQHIDITAVFQRHVSNSISKTVNLPNEATVEDVENAMMYAFGVGCKALTIYRDGSRSTQVLNSPGTTKATETVSPRESRSSRLVGATYKVATGHGTMYVTINGNEMGRPIECFVTLGKSGGCAGANTEAIGRLISVSLQHGVGVETLLTQLRAISCGHVGYQDGTIINSMPDGIAHVLTHFIGDNVLQNYRETPEVSDDLCTSCGGLMIKQEGCETCQRCGGQKCG